MLFNIYNSGLVVASLSALVLTLVVAGLVALWIDAKRNRRAK